MAAEPNHIAGRAGLLAVAIHGLGLAWLTEVESAYRPEGLERWYYSLSQHGVAQSWSAWCFAAGMCLLAAWVAGLARALGPYSWPGAAVALVGISANVLGVLLPFVAVAMVPHGEAAIGQTLLGLALTLNALFSLALGVGIVLLSLAMARDQHFPIWIPGAGLVASIPTLAVVSQAWSPLGADLVWLAAPMWLAWVALVGFRIQNLRRESWDARRAAPELKRLPLAPPPDRSMPRSRRPDEPAAK